MSRYDYDISLEIADQGPPFYAVVMAAMRLADDFNLELLRQSFPEVWDELQQRVWDELQQRYDAPGGVLEGDVE